MSQAHSSVQSKFALTHLHLFPHPFFHPHLIKSLHAIAISGSVVHIGNNSWFPCFQPKLVGGGIF